MATQYLSFEEALRQYDKQADQQDVQLAEQERQEVLKQEVVSTPV